MAGIGVDERALMCPGECQVLDGAGWGVGRGGVGLRHLLVPLRESDQDIVLYELVSGWRRA